MYVWSTSLVYIMIFILGNYFCYQSFSIDFIFSIITLLKLSELWESSERCFKTIFFTFIVPEVRFCALRASWNSTVWHITWGSGLEVMGYTHCWLLQGIYILTARAKITATTTKSKSHQGNGNVITTMAALEWMWKFGQRQTASDTVWL